MIAHVKHEFTSREYSGQNNRKGRTFCDVGVPGTRAALAAAVLGCPGERQGYQKRRRTNASKPDDSEVIVSVLSVARGNSVGTGPDSVGIIHRSSELDGAAGRVRSDHRGKIVNIGLRS